MELIKNFNQYQEEMLLEKIDFKNLLSDFKHSARKHAVKLSIATVVIGTLLATFTPNQAENIISGQNTLTLTEKTILLDTLQYYKDASEFLLSQETWDHIREEETLKLTAYSIGDGMITIGYGHAEPEKSSKYAVGDKITKEEAEKIFIEDVNIAAKGVKRIFEQWKADGNIVKITQGQYDAMVSMAFNMGISGLRQTEFIQELKKRNFKEAAELIKTTGIKKGFSGLEDRRESEYEMFIAPVNTQDNENKKL